MKKSELKLEIAELKAERELLYRELAELKSCVRWAKVVEKVGPYTIQSGSTVIHLDQVAEAL